MTRVILLKIWRAFPAWLQVIASRIVRPLFQVFAAAVIFDADGEVLLVKSTYQRFHPWGLPGGSLDYGESPEDAVLREVHEETGLTVAIEKLLFVKTWMPDRVGLYYICRITDGEFQPSDEVSEFGYFALENLPDVRPIDVELIQQIYAEVERELA
ncbi:MAG: NUDIX domain-containing protein [Anaerolineales bacterium]|nr:NUDIX domain-containing protein [Anaerolineales bacterium]NUQ85979.1 NUDIX domain-containing protein [Anaerolineales bacterium]